MFSATDDDGFTFREERSGRLEKTRFKKAVLTALSNYRGQQSTQKSGGNYLAGARLLLGKNIYTWKSFTMMGTI